MKTEIICIGSMGTILCMEIKSVGIGGNIVTGKKAQ